MDHFIDLPGGAGASYRFRRTTPAELPPMAGNLVVVAGTPARLQVLFCGAARSLARAAPLAAETLHRHPGARLFVRLNVARTARDAEHADIVAGTAPAAQAADLE